MMVTNCWDCPTPLLVLLAEYAFFGLILVGGAWMRRSKRQLVRWLGVLTVVLVGLVLTASSCVAPGWGILVSESPLVVLPPRESLAIMLGLDLVLALAVAYTYWRLRPQRAA
ncbi:MAG TPA: hypothetical protein VGF69_13620 [Thermoanaerobaculia bacterium]